MERVDTDAEPRSVLRLRDTYTRELRAMLPSDGARVRMYDCGPTVYSTQHVGNLYRYIVSDLIRRTLTRFGVEVLQVMNITDVGHLVADGDTGVDKMQLAAEREQVDPMAIAAKYTAQFFADCARLNILRPSVVCQATEHIPAMHTLIAELIDRGHAYPSGDGVYFDVRSYPPYAQLVPQKLTELRAGERVEVNPNKRDPLDFVLWRAEKPGDLQAWDSPWGRGNPGWHIECSAMGLRYLGAGFDLHTGGEDHIFPHHPAEIAQAEAAGHAFARSWLHVHFLQFVGGKMAKSQGNILALDDLVALGIPPIALRVFALEAHYSRPVVFTPELVRGSGARLHGWIETLAEAVFEVGEGADEKDEVGELRQKFDAALAEDLNTSAALVILEETLSELGRTRDRTRKVQLLATVYGFDQILALDLTSQAQARAASWQDIDAPSLELIRERAAARRNGDFARSDELRQTLTEAGIELRDTPAGQVWRKR